MNKTEILTTEEFKKLNSKKQSEQNVQVAVCSYLKKQYPHVIFMCDLTSGMNLGEKIGGMNSRLRSSRGLPDLFIAHPKYIACGDVFSPKVKLLNGGFFIELKKDGIRLKDNSLPKTKHINEQCEILMKLRKLGFKAEFAVGFEEAKKLIDEYLK